MQEEVAEYVAHWEATTDWSRPTITDGLDFLVTEVAEAVDARLRLNSRYVRGRQDESTIIDELADVVFMAYICAIVLGEDLDRAVQETLEKLSQRYTTRKGGQDGRGFSNWERQGSL